MTDTQVKRGEYKGKPTISLPTGSEKYPFSFGLAKAKLIVKDIDEIRKFVDENKGSE